ncbi:CPBP family intramembrane glutamic endopeptidase [Halorussus litoreus]|uniref:CPBP family intramembrane glutamic endopeptidase n=1 Tax=Halorussus litoreus TaxID=1710536 RepID=UPI000E22396D|nr:CPBP family intramembrane glutamic endopeptidase [Halorussus litoreus]
MLSERFPERALARTTSPLDDRLVRSFVAAALPVPLSIAIGIVYSGYVGIPEPSDAAKNVMYGVASLFAVGAIYYLLSDRERAAAFRFRRPSRSELNWTLICFPLGSAAYLGGASLAQAAGLSLGGYEYGLTDPVVVGAVVFGAVIVAPIAEEILFRGVLLGSLLGRGLSPLLAGGVTILTFGAIHVAILGVAGVVATASWAIFPTLLRLRFNNLTGAWLLHFINNIWSYLVVVALGIA